MGDERSAVKQGETHTAFAMAVVALIFAAVFGTAQAAPVAPLPAGVTADLNNLTDVQWRAGGACVAAAAGVTAGAAYVAGDFAFRTEP
jgi:hypothetical protein